jgi:hypothetical protein
MIGMLWFWRRDQEDLVQRKVDDRAEWKRKQTQLETAKQRGILRRKEAAALKRKETRAQARALKEGSENKSPGQEVPNFRTSALSTGGDGDDDGWSEDEYLDYFGLWTPEMNMGRIEEDTSYWDDLDH